jgi:hypothetical protein
MDDADPEDVIAIISEPSPREISPPLLGEPWWLPRNRWNAPAVSPHNRMSKSLPPGNLPYETEFHASPFTTI